MSMVLTPNWRPASEHMAIERRVEAQQKRLERILTVEQAQKAQRVVRESGHRG